MKDRYAVIRELLAKGLECLEGAAQSILEAHEAGDSSKTIAENTNLTVLWVNELIRVARGELLMQVALQHEAVFRALGRCDIQVQKKYMTEPLTVCIALEDGYTTSKLLVYDLSREQVNQVFTNGRVRTVGEQQQMLEALKALERKVVTQSKKRYYLDGRVIVVPEANTAFSKHDINTMIELLMQHNAA